MRPIIRWRRRGLGAAAVLAAAWALAAQPALAAPACQYLTIAELPARFEGNSVLLRGEINKTPVWLIVDTGAASSALFGPAARKLKLRLRQAASNFEGIGGQARTAITDDLTLKLGSSEGRTQLFVLGSRGDGELEGVLVAGLIGRDLLSAFDLEFDLAHDTIRLFTNRSCSRIGLAYWAKDFAMATIAAADATAAIDLTLQLNGRRTMAILDSGSPLTFVTSAAARNAGVTATRLEADSRQEARGIGAGTVETRTAIFDTVTIGDETVRNARLRVGDIYGYNRGKAYGAHVVVGSGNFSDMLLGADFLRSHRLLVAWSQSKIYFTYNGGPIFQAVGSIHDPSTPPTSVTGQGAKPPSAKPNT